MTNLTVSKICIAVGLYLLASTASAYDVQIDTFTVTKNANPVPVVLDPFDDNAPPPSGPRDTTTPPQSPTA